MFSNVVGWLLGLQHIFSDTVNIVGNVGLQHRSISGNVFYCK